MRIALAQLNPIVGDIRGNTARIIQAVQEAKALGAQLLATPELAVIGYPPRDLLLKPAAIDLCAQAVEAIAAASHGITTLVGYPERNLTSVGRPLHNAVAVVRDGQIVTKRFKSLLPTYDVFDETRYFEPGAGGEAELTFLDGKVLGQIGRAHV